MSLHMIHLIMALCIVGAAYFFVTFAIQIRRDTIQKRREARRRYLSSVTTNFHNH